MPLPSLPSILLEKEWSENLGFLCCGCILRSVRPLAGLRPAGNPLIGFPSVRQPTELSDLPLLISLYHQRFRPLRRARRALPSTCQPFEKGWTENFLCSRCGTYPTGRPNRRRAACRAATEAQRGELAASSWERRHAAVMILRPTAAAIHSTQPPPA